MKITILTSYLPNYQVLADLTWLPKLDYAKRHGYETFAQVGEYVPGMEAGFAREKLIYDYMLRNPEVDWVAVQGIDTMIMNHNIKIEDIIAQYPDKNYLITKDVGGINNDSFLIRNCGWSRYWLLFLLSKYAEYQHDCWSSQRCVQHNELHPDFKDGIQIVPQNVLNSYFYAEYPPWNKDTPGDFRPGDFILHLPGMNLQQRLDIFKSSRVQDIIIK